MRIRTALAVVLSVLACFAPGVQAGLVEPPVSRLGDATVPGAAYSPYPTTVAISLVWEIQGDDDLDGSVTVRFRPSGSGAWRDGPAMMRVPAGSYQTFNWTNKHAGSIFGLDEATSYEVELSLSDPDGGSTIRGLNVTTREVPRPMAGAPVKLAGPANFSSIAGSAVPGDIILLENGSFPGFTFARDGAPGKPIVIRGSGASLVGDNIFADNTKHVMLDNLVLNGTVKARSSQNFTMIGCTVTPVGGGSEDDGIILWGRSENGYIADNIVLGVTRWEEASLGASGNNSGEGIVVSGPGHVIRNNLVRGFRDGLSLMEDTQAFDQFSIDFLFNDVDQVADDGLEADFCYHNCRATWNRYTNVFMPMSSQPSLGGPLYFTRNVVYNGLYEAVKLHRNSVGDVAVHNTFVMHGNAFGVYTGDVNSRQWYRNNLFLGGPGKTLNGYDTGPGRVMDLDPFDATSSFDHDAYGTAAATFQGRFRGSSFTGLAQMRNQTTEKNGVQADYAGFNASVSHPAVPFPALAPPDLRIKAGAAVEDKGLRLPGLNDGFKGSGPDIGAFEVGDPLPCWGPCPKQKKDTIPPTVPRNLVATAVSSTQIDLKWDASSDNVGVAGYRVYRNGSQVATSAATTFPDTGLVPSTLYSYNVQAFDAAGNPSVLSAPASATTKDSGGVNSPPVLAAIGDRTVAEGAKLEFTLSASDPDGDLLAFSSSPLPANASLTGWSHFTFNPGIGQAGSYPVTFTAADPDGATDSESITILVTPRNNRPPVARVANAVIEAKVGESVSLDGRPSSDPDGDPLTFRWDQRKGPTAKLDTASTAVATFVPAEAGDYQFELVVRDALAMSFPAVVNVKVDDPATSGGGPPTGWAGLPTTTTIGLLLALAAIAVVVTALVMRRRRRPGSAGSASEADGRRETFFPPP